MSAAVDTPRTSTARGHGSASASRTASVMNGSFLRASLFTSVLAFGVAALAMGLGVLFLALG